MHPHLKTNLYISLFGLAFGLFTGISIFIIHPKTIESEKKDIKKVVESIHTPEATPTPSDFCIDVPILTYHHVQPFEVADEKNQRPQTVTPENFDWHMRTLKEKGYTFITLEDLVQALRTRKTFDEKVIAITLDDAYLDAYTYAYPIAQKYDVVLNIGVITGLIGNSEHLTGSQIVRMHESGQIAFHNHTWSHRNLQSADATTITSQILKPQEHLKQWIDTPSAILYYPYGVHDEQARNIVEANNFDAAFELSFSRKSTQQCLSEIYQLPRLRVGNAGPGVYDL